MSVHLLFYNLFTNIKCYLRVNTLSMTWSFFWCLMAFNKTWSWVNSHIALIVSINLWIAYFWSTNKIILFKVLPGFICFNRLHVCFNCLHVCWLKALTFASSCVFCLVVVVVCHFVSTSTLQIEKFNCQRMLTMPFSISAFEPSRPLHRHPPHVWAPVEGRK